MNFFEGDPLENKKNEEQGQTQEEKENLNQGSEPKSQNNHQEKDQKNGLPPENLPVPEVNNKEEKPKKKDKVEVKYNPKPGNFEGIDLEKKRVMNYFENDPKQKKIMDKPFGLQTKSPLSEKQNDIKGLKCAVNVNTKKALPGAQVNGSLTDDQKIEKSRRQKKALTYGLMGVGVIVLIIVALFGVEFFDTYLKKVPIEKVLKGDVNVVFKVNTDADFYQYKLLDEHMKKFPGYTLLAKELDKSGEGKTPSEFLKDKLEQHNLSFQQDIQAVVGGEVFVLVPDLRTLEQTMQSRISMLGKNTKQAFELGLQRKRQEAGLLAQAGETVQDDGSKVLGLTTDYYTVSKELPNIDPLDFILGAKIKDLKEAKRVLEKISSDKVNYKVQQAKHSGYVYYKVENLNCKSQEGQILDVCLTYHALVGGNWIMGTNEEDVKQIIDQRKSHHFLSMVKGPLQKNQQQMPVLADNYRYRGVMGDISQTNEQNILSVYFKVNFKKFFEIPDNEEVDYGMTQYFKYPEDLVGGFVFRTENEGLVLRSITNHVSFEGVENESIEKGLVEKIPSTVDSRYTDVVLETADVKNMYYSFKKANLTDDGLEEWNNLRGEINDSIGVDIERDIVDQIGGNVAFSLFAKRELEPEMCFFVEINDREKIVDSAKKMIEMVKNTYIGLLSMGSGMYMDAYDENGVYAPQLYEEENEKANAAIEAVMNSQLVETQTELGTIYSYKLPDTIFSFDFGFSDNVLILGSHYSLVKELISELSSNNAPKMSSDESFRNMAKYVYPSGYSKAYVNTLGVWNSIEYYLKTYAPTDSQEEKDSIFALGSIFRTVSSVSQVDAISADSSSAKSAAFMSIKELPADEKARAEKIIDDAISGSLVSARERARIASLQATMASATIVASLCINDGGSIKPPLDNKAGGGDICDNTNITAEKWPPLNGSGLEDAGYHYGTTNNAMIVATDGSSPVVTCTVATGSCVRN